MEMACKPMWLLDRGQESCVCELWWKDLTTCDVNAILKTAYKRNWPSSGEWSGIPHKVRWMDMIHDVTVCMIPICYDEYANLECR